MKHLVSLTRSKRVFSGFGKKHNSYAVFVYGSLYLGLLMAMLFVILFIFNPVTADWLAQEDFIIENFTAMFALVAAVVVGSIGVIYLRKRDRLRFIFSIIISVAFFIISMEEISWGQRIFEIGSTDFFLENNMQAEINFHNLHTHIFMAMFIIATFIVFTVVPFFEKYVRKLLKKINLSKLIIFIPSQWIILAFVIALGFSSAFARNSDVYQLTVLVLTLMIVTFYLSVKAPKYIEEHKFILYLTTIFIIVSTATINLIDYEGLGLRPHFPPEYREFFICWAILLYSIDLLFRYRFER